jgi:hypothetical protein
MLRVQHLTCKMACQYCCMCAASYVKQIWAFSFNDGNAMMVNPSCRLTHFNRKMDSRYVHLFCSTAGWHLLDTTMNFILWGACMCLSPACVVRGEFGLIWFWVQQWVCASCWCCLCTWFEPFDWHYHCFYIVYN